MNKIEHPFDELIEAMTDGQPRTLEEAIRILGESVCTIALHIRDQENIATAMQRMVAPCLPGSGNDEK